jgi:hypothetical protein
MTDSPAGNALLENLGTFGFDLRKWPPERVAGARERLLSDPEFRRAWEAERDLDRSLDQWRAALDAEIGGSGALGRIRQRALAPLANPLAAIGWQRIAAAVLLAGMLGGAMDLFLAERTAAPADYVMLDPLYGLAETELQ